MIDVQTITVDGVVYKPDTIRQLVKKHRVLFFERIRLYLLAQGRFWRCLECKYVQISNNCVHPCRVCGNRPSKGLFTETNLEAFLEKNPEVMLTAEREYAQEVATPPSIGNEIIRGLTKFRDELKESDHVS